MSLAAGRRRTSRSRCATGWSSGSRRGCRRKSAFVDRSSIAVRAGELAAAAGGPDFLLGPHASGRATCSAGQYRPIIYFQPAMMARAKKLDVDAAKLDWRTAGEVDADCAIRSWRSGRMRTSADAGRQSGEESAIMGRTSTFASTLSPCPRLEHGPENSQSQGKTRRSGSGRRRPTRRRAAKKAAGRQEGSPPSGRAGPRAAKDIRLKAFWGVFNQTLKRIALFEYSERKKADKMAAELTASGKSPHFVQLVKEVVQE